MKSGRWLICALMLFFCVSVANAKMTIHHINVEQGEATLLEFDTAAVLPMSPMIAGKSKRSISILAENTLIRLSASH